MKNFRNALPPPVFLAALFIGLTPFWVIGTTGRVANFGSVQTAKPQGSEYESGSDVAIQMPIVAFGDRLQEMTSRPLFSETRRQPIPEVEVAIKPPEQSIVVAKPEPEVQITPPTPPSISFLGYVRHSGEQRVLLQLMIDGTDVWALKGDQVLGWTVQHTSENTVTLEKEGVEHVVEINR